MTQELTTAQKLSSWAQLLENKDFSSGASMRRWWAKELAKAETIEASKRKEWALDMLEYLGDFAESSYYVAEEIAELLKEYAKETEAKAKRANHKAEAVQYLKNKIAYLNKQYNTADEYTDRGALLSKIKALSDALAIIK